MPVRRVIYSEPQDQFFKDVDSDAFISKMSRVASDYHINAGEAEQLSWMHNAPKIKDLLIKSQVEDTYVTFEYLVPYNMKRIDCMIYGSDQDRKGYIVHIELKQWSNNSVREAESDGNFTVTESSEASDDPDSSEEPGSLMAYTGGRYQSVAHPSQQVRGYDGYLRGFIQILGTDEVGLEGMAYCYNYCHRPKAMNVHTVLYDSKYAGLLGQFRTYSRDDLDDLAKELHKVLCNGNGLSIFNKMMQSPIRPSKKLLDEAAQMIEQGNVDSFSLIEDQIVAKNVILDKIRTAKYPKNVIIIKGGPGTGKTVIAMNIMATLAAETKRTGKRWNFHYATKSKPLLEGVRHQLSAKSGARLLFSNVTQFIPANFTDNSLDVLLVDEAHRITQSANNQYTKAEKRTDMPQVDTLIRCAMTSVFFIDDRQAIRGVEIGSSDLIRAAAKKFNAHIEEVELKSQFRCNGSDNYLDWLEQVLYNEPVTARFSKDEFDFRIFDDPKSLYDTIVEKDSQENVSARLTAGFCWKWSDVLDSDGDLVKDVQIGDFAIPWETKDKLPRIPEGYPHWFEWAYKPNGIKQCGCIYTAQGFEFDYIGVIVGKDLYYDEAAGKIVTNIKESKDPVLKRGKDKVDEYIRNIYRVLMSRGMKGCYVYFCDKALEEYVRDHLDQPVTEEESAQKTVQTTKVVPEMTIEPASFSQDVDDNVKFVSFLPVYSMKAACGYFGDGEPVEKSGWMKVEGFGRLNHNMFIVKASGHSMEPKIHDGDYCIFQANPAGSRNGKIVLVQHRDYFDTDNSGSYSIKTYQSKKSVSDDGRWQHDEIDLVPSNPAYDTIVITPDADENSYQVVGELIGVI